MKYNKYTLFFIGLVILLIGFTFKIMHYPGQDVLMIAGLAICGFIFPVFVLVPKIRSQSNRINKYLYIISSITLIAISTAMVLQIADITWGYYISITGLFCLTFLFIPALLFVVIKQKENRINRILILILSAGYLIFSFAINRIVSVEPVVMDAFEIVDKGIELSTSNIDNKPAYPENLESHPKGVELISLKDKTEYLLFYISQLKHEIDSAAESSETPVVKVMFDDGKATVLKTKIEVYKSFILTEFDRVIDSSKVEKGLSTSIQNPEYSKSWEDERFNHIPMAGVITILSHYQVRIRNVEKEIIENIIETK